DAKLVFTRYAQTMSLLAQSFRVLPIELWWMMQHYIPHIHQVGDEWVKHHLNLTDRADRQRALVFMRRTAYYLRRRREVGRGEWLEMGLFLAEIDDEYSVNFLLELGIMWSDLGEKRKALDYYEQALP